MGEESAPGVGLGGREAAPGGDGLERHDGIGGLGGVVYLAPPAGEGVGVREGYGSPAGGGAPAGEDDSDLEGFTDDGCDTDMDEKAMTAVVNSMSA